MPVVIDPLDEPVEIAPGRGDLRKSSITFDAFAGGPFWDGIPVSYANIFRTQTWVGIAVRRLLFWSVMVPLKVYRRIDDATVVRLRPGDHPLAAAVVSPWDRGTMSMLVTSMLGSLLVQGNDLMDVHEGAGGALRFEPLDWRCVAPIRLDETDPNSEIVGWKVRQGSTQFERSSDTVMHLRWWSPLGQLGISPLEHIRTTVLSEDAAVRWAMSLLANGARPDGVVELSDATLGLEPEERQLVLDNARKDLRGAHAGPDSAGLLPVLPSGLTWRDTKRTTAVEAELISQRFVNRNEVAAIYMIPPPMIGQLDKSSFNNITTQREMAYTDGLAPPLVIIEQMVNAHVVRGLLREDDVFVEFDFAGILRGDRLKEIQAMREAIGIGLLTPNEGRETLNLPPSEEKLADSLWMPWNNTRPMGDPPPQKGAR